MKRFFRMIAGLFKTVLTSLDRLAKNFSRMPNNMPELPPLTNSGPLIENEGGNEKFIERNLGREETWDENTTRAAQLYRSRMNAINRTTPRPGTGRTTPSQLKSRAEWERTKLFRNGFNYGVDNHCRHNNH